MINKAFLAVTIAVIILLILALTIWPWFALPALVIIGALVVFVLMMWRYQRRGSP